MESVSVTLLIGMLWLAPLLLFVLIDDSRGWRSGNADLVWLAGVCATSWIGFLLYLLWRGWRPAAER